MTTEKANEVMNYAAGDDLRGIDEALIAIIRDLQARIQELEAKQ